VTSTGSRRLAAILIADVVGFSRHMERDDAGTLARLRAIRGEIVDPAIAANDGRIVKTTGDGLLAEFSSADASLRCAVAIQRALADRNALLPADDRIELRIGINLGDVIAEGDDIFGDGVNVAARLEALAPPGGICVSQAVRDQVHGSLDIAFVDVGEQRVKNIERPIGAFTVDFGGARAPVRGRSEARAVSIGVLPFDAGDETLARRAKAIGRDFTAMLARCGSLVSVTPMSAAGEVAVRYLVEGDVRQERSGIVVDVRFLNEASGEQVWNDAVSLPHEDDGTRNARRLHGLAWDLSRALVGAEVRRLTGQPPEAPTPLDNVVLALALDRTEPDLRERMRRKELLFEDALRRDPNCVPALLGLAIACDARFTHDVDAAREDLVRRMSELTAKALRLNDTQPVTWLLRSAALMYAGQWQASLEACARSIALEPYSSDLLLHRAWLTMLCGRPEDALAVVAEAAAQGSRPNAVQMQVTCEANLLCGRCAEAVEAGERSLGLSPNDEFDTHVCLVAANQRLGDKVKASYSLEAVLRMHPRYTIAIHRSRRHSRHPQYLALVERHVYPALKEAGLPDT
jgi:adenylate cyclase